MILPPRALFVRLIFWIVVFGWAVWKMKDLGSSPITGVSLLDTPAVEIVLTPGVAPVTAEGPPPAIVDPAAVFSAMEAAIGAAAPCGVRGSLHIELGPTGLTTAYVRGGEIAADRDAASATRCAADAVWSAPWPRASQAFELEQSLRAE